MAIYTGNDLDNLIKQINQDNPTLPFELNKEDYIYGTPVAITPALSNGHNTRVRILAKGSAPYTGEATVTYRRLSYANLFRSVAVEVHRAYTNPTNLAWAAPVLTSRYGVEIDPKRNSSSGTWTTPGQSRNITALAGNYQYLGVFPAVWREAGLQLGLDLLTLTDLDGRTWPGGNDFTTYMDRRDQGEFLIPAVDTFDVFKTHDPQIPTTPLAPGANGPIAFNAAIANNTASANFFADILTATGVKFDHTTTHTTVREPGDPAGIPITGVQLRYFGLPHPNYPWANREGFNTAVIISNPVAGTVNTKAPFAFYLNI